MLPYIIMLIIISFFLLFYKGRKKSKVTWCLMMLLMMMCGLRGETVGTDTHNYISYYLGYSDVDRFGIFYNLLSQGVSLVYNDEHAFLMAMAVLTYIPLAYVITTRSTKPLLSVYMFLCASALFFLETMNLSRESIAIAWLMMFMVFWEEDKKKSALICLTIAFFAHKYAIIIIPFLLLEKLVLTERGVIFAIIGSAAIGLIGILDHITNFLVFLSGQIADSEFYYDYIKYASREIGSDWNIVGQLSHILPISALTYLCYCDDTKDTYLYKCLLVGTIMLNLFVSVKYCERLSSFFTISQIIVVPVALYSRSNSKRKRFCLIGLLFLLALLFIYQLNVFSRVVGLDTVVPYTTCLK